MYSLVGVDGIYVFVMERFLILLDSFVKRSRGRCSEPGGLLSSRLIRPRREQGAPTSTLYLTVSTGVQFIPTPTALMTLVLTLLLAQTSDVLVAADLLGVERPRRSRHTTPVRVTALLQVSSHRRVLSLLLITSSFSHDTFPVPPSLGGHLVHVMAHLISHLTLLSKRVDRLSHAGISCPRRQRSLLSLLCLHGRWCVGSICIAVVIVPCARHELIEP